MFKLEIKTGNNAFQPEPDQELGRILTALASRLADGTAPNSGVLHDLNGNTVGRWELVPD